MPVGHIWKFDFEEYGQRYFGVKYNFSKFELDMSSSTFSRKLKISEIQYEKDREKKRGKVVKFSSGKLLVAISDT